VQAEFDALIREALASQKPRQSDEVVAQVRYRIGFGRK
jgi:hypothetical protein